jgi:hypothetical protein
VEKRCRIYGRYNTFIFKKLQLMLPHAGSCFGKAVQNPGKNLPIVNVAGRISAGEARAGKYWKNRTGGKGEECAG